jgi:hypothetical protein
MTIPRPSLVTSSGPSPVLGFMAAMRHPLPRRQAAALHQGGRRPAPYARLVPMRSVFNAHYPWSSTVGETLSGPPCRPWVTSPTKRRLPILRTYRNKAAESGGSLRWEDIKVPTSGNARSATSRAPRRRRS